MAIYYAVEFPLEDSKSKGPHSVPENKVKVKNGKTLVLWSVVDENGDVAEQYFEATNLKKGSKKECGEFIDRLKKSREEVKVSNTDGRSRKKPAKLDDYEDPDDPSAQADKPPLKKPRKALFQVDHLGVLANADADLGNSSADEADEDLDGTAVLARWKQNVAGRRKANAISRQNQSTPASKPTKVSKPTLKLNKRQEQAGRSKTAVKKAREETADSQSHEISKKLPLTMKVIRQSLNGGGPEFSMNVSCASTFGALRRQQLAQMTGISPSNQFLILKGEEWRMEDSGIVTDVWSPQEFVAISEKDAKCIEISDGENKEMDRMGETQWDQQDKNDEMQDVNVIKDSDNTFNWTGPEQSGKLLQDIPVKGSMSDLEEKIDDLQRQMTLMTREIQHMGVLLREFASCRACIKKLYKTITPPEGKSPLFTSVQHPSVPLLSTITTNTPNQPVRKEPVQATPKTTKPLPIEKEAGSSSGVVLIGSPSRGVYVQKARVELIKSSQPKRFALKLFELVFGREEAKQGSVEGKGEKLSKLDPNRLAAVKEETETRFAEDKNCTWPEIRKALGEKCRMVRNNRCLIWAGVDATAQN